MKIIKDSTVKIYGLLWILCAIGAALFDIALLRLPAMLMCYFSLLYLIDIVLYASGRLRVRASKLPSGICIGVGCGVIALSVASSMNPAWNDGMASKTLRFVLLFLSVVGWIACRMTKKEKTDRE